jgi:hypothetical protein
LYEVLEEFISDAKDQIQYYKLFNSKRKTAGIKSRTAFLYEPHVKKNPDRKPFFI